ncbi:hypothetical protein DSO57_1027806 [Entomophthora muscae]|uniref:Uncharacterized protein n=1 Tax=Entomophthora muscae TaxID=34485 RepID=A0ACC2SQR1_9FUNG|nr:hypothetical protein DSO57_1027806 [Entomophthora muscae]
MYDPDCTYQQHNECIVLKPSQFLNLIGHSILFTDIDKEVLANQMMNPPQNTAQLEQVDNVWYRKDSLWVFSNKLKDKIINCFYNLSILGHGGVTKTLKEFKDITSGPQQRKQ